METVKRLLRVLAALRRGKEGILGVNLLSLLGEAILLLPGLFLAYSDCYPHCNMISQDITKVPLNQGKVVCRETELLLFLHKNGEEDTKAVERPGL